MTEKIIGFCGLICNECPAFIATKNNDHEKRKETAKLWSKEFKTEIKPDEINCTGCTVEGVKFTHCKYSCEIRKCGLGKNIKNCAYCEQYPCVKLREFFKMAPNCELTLDKISKSR